MRLRFAAVTLLALGLSSACPRPGACPEDCTAGQTCCSGTCVDLDNDKSNCGTCGTVCEFPNATPTCRGGHCQLQCETGFGNCNAKKDDGCEEELAVSSVACGRCGNVCDLPHSAPVCAASSCAVGTCDMGYADCDKDAATGCEVNTRTDVLHCGACGTPCTIANGTGVCDAGTCQVGACDAGAADCDLNPATGCEALLASDDQHCGDCGTVCDARRSCAEGGCWAGQLVVYGGLPNLSGAPPTGDVFVYALDGGTFTKLSPATPAGAPPARSHHAIAWDRRRDRMLVWGGANGVGVAVPNEVWALDFTVEPPAWRKVTTSGAAPPSRTSPAFAVDDAAGQLYVFGGTTDLGEGKSDLSRFDFASDTWTSIHGDDAPDAPGSRVNAVGAFELALRRFVVSGGTNTTTHAAYDELWEFDVASGVWRSPPRSGGAVPRGLGALYGGPPLYLFSGVTGLMAAPGMVSDFASLDLSQTGPWQQLTVGVPASRFNAATAQLLGQLYVFGGAAVGSMGATPIPDLWRYQPGAPSWTQLDDGTGVAPTGKFAARMVAR